MYVYQKCCSDMGIPELELGIGLAHSLASMFILISHLGIWCGLGPCSSSMYGYHCISDMGTLEFELDIGWSHGCSQYVDFDNPLELK